MCSVLRTDLDLQRMQEHQMASAEQENGPRGMFYGGVLVLIVIALTAGLVRGCTDVDPGPWQMGDGSQMEAR